LNCPFYAVLTTCCLALYVVVYALYYISHIELLTNVSDDFT